MTETKIIPIFPLDLVLFPRQELPLRIFEPRYKQLVDDCMLGDGQFGVCLIDEHNSVKGWNSPNLVGTIAKINKCEDVELDGLQLHIETMGRNSFRIKKIIPPIISQPTNYDPLSVEGHQEVSKVHEQIGTQEKMYIQAEVEMIPEIDENISLTQWKTLIELWKKKIIHQALPQIVESHALDHVLEQYYLTSDTPTIDYIYSLAALGAKNPNELQPLLEAHELDDLIEKTQELLSNGKIQMTMYADFFESGYTLKQDKDIYHYLDRIASQNIEGQKRGLSHRIVRALVNIYRLKSIQELEDQIHSILQDLRQCYDGQKNKPNIQKLKGMIREFEEELVWAHYGVQVKDVHHLRLGFYQGDTFTEAPEHERDVKPILQLLRDRNPDVITLALDPEGSGPDTHYKVLQAIADALRMWGEEKDLSQVHVWGYRNVWFRFDPSEADMIVPVSINSMAMLRDTFMNCYLSQKDASFPSYELDGPFCDLTQKIWVDQHQEMELVMGRDYWYQNEHPRLRATHGLVYLKDMSADDFIQEAQVLEKSMEGQIK